MKVALRLPLICLGAWFLLAADVPVDAAEAELQLPEHLATHEDGRASIHALYAAYSGLRERGWQLDIIANSRPAGADDPIPIIALRSPVTGPATWIISGIHGEETAGPNAIAGVIDVIATFGKQHPVVLVPLCNPHGYARNWRYLNVPAWSDGIDAQSVGDSSHLLPDTQESSQPRLASAANPEADAITRYILDTMSAYPVVVSIDLHEDDMLGEGYVYSQGIDGVDDPLAIESVRVLRETGIPVKPDGQTRFAEPIVDGIVGPVTDSSIDEFMSAKEIIVDGTVRAGPGARTVLVFETPAREFSLKQRQAAHEALIRRLLEEIARE